MTGRKQKRAVHIKQEQEKDLAKQEWQYRMMKCVCKAFCLLVGERVLDELHETPLNCFCSSMTFLSSFSKCVLFTKLHDPLKGQCVLCVSIATNRGYYTQRKS